MIRYNRGKSILSYRQVHFFIVNYVKKLDFVKMSVVLDDGDNPLPHAWRGFGFPHLPTFI